jgi:hypothetical protein
MPRVELLPAVQDLDARIRGRLIYQALMRCQQCERGSFVFAGWLVSYFSDGDCIFVGMEEYYS